MTADQQHAATTEFNEALASGFETGNLDEVGTFYTETSSLMPPRGKFIGGRGSISAFWLGVRNRFSGVAFTTVNLRSLSDNVLRETGTYVMRSNNEQSPSPEGKYLFVWERVDGEWQIESSIWNRNADAGSAGRRAGGQGLPGGQGRGGGGGQAGGYRRGGAQGGPQGGGYRQGGAMGGGGRPSFQGGGGRRQGGGQGRGGGQGGDGGSGNLYDGNTGLYSDLKD
jgi:ketosteroid isomerase-like protein